MRKEGTGKPRAPDIDFRVGIKARELCFEEVPDPDVRFRGNTRRNSVWGSKRENLPDEVQEGVVYRDAEVRLRIATEITDSDPDLLNSLNIERGDPDSGYQRQKTVKRETEDNEETE